MNDKAEVDYVEFEFPDSQWMTMDGRYFLEESDYHAGGAKWRVHKYDADPFPSSPHAHCIEGRPQHKGCKLHLGTGVLYQGKKAWKRLSEDDFLELIKLIQPKFPGLTLPLPA